MTVVDDDRCGGFRLVIIRCYGYIVKQIFAVIVLVIFPTGKCIAVMLRRCRESCFVESGSDFVLLGSDYGAVKAVTVNFVFSLSGSSISFVINILPGCSNLI